MQHFESTFFGRTAAIVLATIVMGNAAIADAVAPAKGAPSNIPAPTKHQLMKECMAKERAAISGREDYDLTADCRDITRTEKQNADALQKAQEDDRNRGG